MKQKGYCEQNWVERETYIQILLLLFYPFIPFIIFVHWSIHGKLTFLVLFYSPIRCGILETWCLTSWSWQGCMKDELREREKGRKGNVVDISRKYSLESKLKVSHVLLPALWQRVGRDMAEIWDEVISLPLAFPLSQILSSPMYWFIPLSYIMEFN